MRPVSAPAVRPQDAAVVLTHPRSGAALFLRKGLPPDVAASPILHVRGSRPRATVLRYLPDVAVPLHRATVLLSTEALRAAAQAVAATPHRAAHDPVPASALHHPVEAVPAEAVVSAAAVAADVLPAEVVGNYFREIRIK